MLTMSPEPLNCASSGFPKSRQRLRCKQRGRLHCIGESDASGRERASCSRRSPVGGIGLSWAQERSCGNTCGRRWPTRLWVSAGRDALKGRDGAIWTSWQKGFSSSPWPTPNASSIFMESFKVSAGTSRSNPFLREFVACISLSSTPGSWTAWPQKNRICIPFDAPASVRRKQSSAKGYHPIYPGVPWE